MLGLITDKQKEVLDRSLSRLGWNPTQTATALRIFARKAEPNSLSVKEASCLLSILSAVEYVKRWGGNDAELMSHGQGRKISVLSEQLSFDIATLLILMRMVTGVKHDNILAYSMAAGAKLINLLEAVRTEHLKIGWLK